MRSCGSEGPLPLPVPNPDPLSNAARIDPCPNPLDHASSVAVRDDPCGYHGTGAGPCFPIGGVHTRSMHPDEDLASTGHEVRDFAALKDLTGGAVALVPDCFHPTRPLITRLDI